MQDHDLPEAYMVPAEGGRERPRVRVKPVTVIGRATDCDLVLGSTRISRRHAELRWEGGQFLLRDLDSLNGTRLNGEVIAGPSPVAAGDVIELADASLRFETSGDSKTEVFVPISGQLRVDALTHQVSVLGEEVSLTPKEFRLVALLDARSPAVVTFNEIASEVWPELDGSVSEDSIAQLVTRLRRKLGAAARHDGMIVNVRGFGYRLDPTPDSSQ